MAFMLSSETQASIDRERIRNGETRRSIGASHGDVPTYLSRLGVHVMETSASPLLAPFYALYERTFPLAEEREPLSGFKTVLDFNENREVQGVFGPLREAVMVMMEPGSNEVVAAANYIVMSYPKTQKTYVGFDGSCQLNFLCVDARLRGLGLGQHLLDKVDAEVRRIIADATGVSDPSLFMTIEQNNPERMSPEQIETDAAAAVIDPMARTKWWANRGYRKLDFDYEQPPLSPDHEPCAYIDYYVRFPGASLAPSSLPAPALLEHLRRFFFVSVGKFQVDIKQGSPWMRQRDDLEERRDVTVEPASSALA